MDHEHTCRNVRVVLPTKSLRNLVGAHNAHVPPPCPGPGGPAGPLIQGIVGHQPHPDHTPYPGHRPRPPRVNGVSGRLRVSGKLRSWCQCRPHLATP